MTYGQRHREGSRAPHGVQGEVKRSHDFLLEGMSNPNAFLSILCYLGIMIRFRKIPENIHQRINSLVDFLKNDPNIVFVYLFGGLLRDKQNPLSDVDIAIYVKEVMKLNYLNFFNEITNILGTDEIDLVVLNNAPITLTGRILQNKENLVDKNPFLRHKYESLILRKFFDFTMKEKVVMKRRYRIG